MIPNPFDSGKLEKMTITALKPLASADDVPAVSDDPALKYMVQVNPESYRIDHEIKYDRREAHGNSASKASYSFSSPKTLEFEFMFDGTGVIPPPAGPLDNVPIAGAVADLLGGDDEDDDVSVQLEKFLKVVAYSGEEHQPPNVRLIWGTLLFDCVMTALAIDYKLFKPDGSPLRAVATATFEESIPDVLRENKEKNNSPDLTHIRTVVDGDKLPLMSHTIYRKAKHYIEVARVNKLFAFRNLRAGTQIRFPPVDKSAR